MKTTLRVAAVAAATVSLAGCGLFKSSGSGGKYQANDPNRTVASMVANLYVVTPFNKTSATPTGIFRAILRDSSGNQFYGPKVSLDDKDVSLESDLGPSTQYSLKDLPVATGKTYVTAVQGHTATSAPQPPPLVPTSPTPAMGTDANQQPIQLAYYDQTLGQGVTVTWTGGDPAQPVYIFVEDIFSGRRLFMKEDPAAAPNDPENFGLPIPNSGSYTIPAQVTQRIQQTNGTVATQTLTVFDNPNAAGGDARSYDIYIVQRQSTQAPPIQFSIGSQATITARVLAPSK